MDFIMTCSCVSLYFAHTYNLYCPPNPSSPKTTSSSSTPLPISLLLPPSSQTGCIMRSHLQLHMGSAHERKHAVYCLAPHYSVSFSYLLLELFLSHCLPSIPCHIHKCVFTCTHASI